MRVHPTVTASTMITRFNSGRKVRCHKGAVEILKGLGSMWSVLWNRFFI
jgi:hypothetical protein